MMPNLRRKGSALLVAATLVAAAGLGSPAMAFAQDGPAGPPGFTSSSVFAKVAAWLGQWFGKDIQHFSGRTGHAMDPDGEAATAETTAPEAPELWTEEGGHSMDPNG